MLALLLSLSLLVLQPPEAHGCAALKATGPDGFVVAKNYDWIPRHGHGMAFVNKRGVAKTALLLRGRNPVRWTSKYGSVSFSQMGADFPVGGMNEKGLVVEILQLSATKHIPETDPRPAVNEAQWVQYHLDTAASLDDVIRSAPRLRVEKAFLKTHYFVCDFDGACGLFEYLDGELEIISGRKFSIPVAVNHTWRETMDFMSKVEKGLEDDDGAARIKRERSLRRFARAARLLRSSKSRDEKAAAAASKAAADVRMSLGLNTLWSLIYEPRARKIHLYTQAAPDLKSIDVAAFDFSCASPRRAFDINRPERGAVNGFFAPLTDETNRELIDRNWLVLAPGLRRKAARYPASTICTESP